MIERPRVAPGFHTEIVPEEPAAIVLLSEHETQLLRGQLYRTVVPLLDGRHTVPELIAQLAGQVSAPEVYFVVMRLRDQGYVVDADAGMPEATAAFWQVQHMDAHEATAHLAASRVSVRALGAVSAAPLEAALASLDIVVGDESTLDVVVTDDYLRPELHALNVRALAAQRPWMLLKPVGLELWLGPIFRPHETGCWACLAQRLRDNRPVETWLTQQAERRSEFPGTSRGALASSIQSAVQLAATSVAQWMATGAHPTLVGQVLTIHAATLEARTHRLVRRPQCPACGAPASRTTVPTPLVLEPRPKGFTTDGGHRHVSPAETWRRYGHHVSAITGVVPDLWRAPDADDAIAPIYVAPNAWRTAKTLKGVRSGLRQGNHGKGKTDAQARVSGLCEALERYSGAFQGDETRLTARYEALGEAAIHPADCLLFSQAQYRERQEWNATNRGFNHVPEPFDEAQSIEWSPVWSLSQHRVCYVPTALGYYGYPLPDTHRFCRADSNGCAAGNTLEEAILQGFLELVERDSVALWWYNRVQRPAVDLRSFGEPYFPHSI
jgi:oxazoline/thiazoline synthase